MRAGHGLPLARMSTLSDLRRKTIDYSISGIKQATLAIMLTARVTAK